MNQADRARAQQRYIHAYLMPVMTEKINSVAQYMELVTSVMPGLIDPLLKKHTDEKGLLTIDLPFFLQVFAAHLNWTAARTSVEFQESTEEKQRAAMIDCCLRTILEETMFQEKEIPEDVRHILQGDIQARVAAQIDFIGEKMADHISSDPAQLSLFN